MLQLLNTIFSLFMDPKPGETSGFSLGEDTLAAGYEPNTMLLVISFMAMGIALAMYVQFGLSFMSRGRKTENPAQGSYYRGLGMFILMVALSEGIYLIDVLNRDVNHERIFLETSNYSVPFESLLVNDYYIPMLTLILVSLAFLTYPMEKYLYGQERKPLTVFLSVSVPFPVILRVIERNHENLGLEIGSDIELGFHYDMISMFWMIILAGMTLSFIYLLRLYISLGNKAPKGSKLRKKSRLIIYGMVIWVVAIFLTSTVTKEISDVTSSWGPNQDIDSLDPLYGLYTFVGQNGLYSLLPLFVPTLLIISLSCLVSGFTRDY
jgi:hypothetical protein